MTYTTEQLAHFPWIVSTDTLRAEDLLPKYWQTAETLAVLSNRPELINPQTLASLALLVGEDSRQSDWSDDLANQTLEELADALQDAAPCGFYFGANEGDGACFGFWLSDDWADALEVLGLGNDDPTGWADLIARLDADGLDPSNIEDAYQGQAAGWSAEKAGADHAQQLAEDMVESAASSVLGGWPFTCIDWEEAWRELELGDGYRVHDIGGGDWLVFRSV